MAILNRLFISLLLSLPLAAQLNPPAVVQSNVPDFGAVASNWGHLQFFRPFGIQGIHLQNWSDLASIHPLSGEPYNTDRQGWFPHEQNVSLWSQMHPALTTPADTTAPSLLVNYKQGDGEFNDFTLWYHNSLGKNIRYGWNSKMRSHTRFLGVTPYDEQRHRLQMESQIEGHSVRFEAGYTHQLNPLYMYEQDSIFQYVKFNDSLQIRSDRWDGSLHWQNKDSNATGSELFARVQGGVWDWPNHEEQSLSALVYWGTRFQFKTLPALEFKLGTFWNQLGDKNLSLPFFEFKFPEIQWNRFGLELGIENHGGDQWLPDLGIHFTREAFALNYQTETVVELLVWNESHASNLVHHFNAEYDKSRFGIKTGTWMAERNGASISGYYGQTRFSLPWDMQVKLAASKVNDPADWVWTKQQINWEIDQGLVLFKRQLYGHLKLWGRHVFDPQAGVLSGEGRVIQSLSFADPISVQHLLNYTISGQVSTLIIAYTHSNILQDPTWGSYTEVPWESEYLLMANQFSESRFRYLSLIWVFDN